MSNDPRTDHSYDGIEEYDNPLPGWWKWLFIATVAFTPFYWMYFHLGAPGRTAVEQFDVSMAANTRLRFAEMGDLIADQNTILVNMSKPDMVNVGQSVFRSNCVSCHGRDAQGTSAAPNLTDEHFKNIKVVEDIARVIQSGAGNGAMPAWGGRLHKNEVVLLASYIASIRGTNVAGRAAEGVEIEPWPETAAEETPTETPTATTEAGG